MEEHHSVPITGVLNKLSIKDLSISGKRVFIRVDFNVPLDENMNITDDRRIRSTLATINYAIDEGSKIILASHLGSPKGKPDKRYTLASVARRLQRLIKKEVTFVPNCTGPEVEEIVNRMSDGDIVLLENLRFNPGEEENSEDFSKSLAKLADFYINDAFGATHRRHASMVGITKLLPSAAGFLLQKEIDYLQGVVNHPVRPFVAVLGGATVSGKIDVIRNLEDKVDKVIIGGGMAYTFLKAMGYNVGDSIAEDDMLDLANEIRNAVVSKGIKFYLPVDCVIAQSIEAAAETKLVTAQEIPNGWKAVDIGPASVKLFSEALESAKTILWNGPMGVFEVDAFSRGTFSIAHSIADAYALTIVGGGDTDLAVSKAGVSESISFISTGGRAALLLLEGQVLPGLEALTDKEIKDSE